MMKLTVKSNQSLMDMAVEHLGAFDAVMELAFANGISITDQLETGSELAEVDVVDEKTAKLFGNLYNKPATMLGIEDTALIASLNASAPYIYNSSDEYGKSLISTLSSIVAADLVKVKNNQSLFDISIEYFGSFDAVMELAFANGISITDELEVASVLKRIDVLDDRTAKLFGNLYNKPATALSIEDDSLVDDIGPNPIDVGPFDYTFDYTFHT